MASEVAVIVLLDTCAVLAIVRGSLPGAASDSLRSAEQAWVSAVSAWELAIKAGAGKLRLSQPAYAWFSGVAERYNLRELPLDSRTACIAAALPPIHRDPFDRVLAAIAQLHGIPVVTSDKNIARYPGVKTLW